GGSGQVVFAGTREFNYLIGNGTLTIGAGLTIRGGSGQIGQATEPVINQGTISADVADKAISILGEPFTNKGTVEVKNGATLSFRRSWSNAGTVRLADGTLNLGGSFKTADLAGLQRSGGTLNITELLDNTGE